MLFTTTLAATSWAHYAATGRTLEQKATRQTLYPHVIEFILCLRYDLS